MPGYHIPTLKQNFGALFGLNMVDGVNSIQVSHYREFIEAGNKVSQQTAFLRVTEIINPVFLSLLNTKYVLSPNELNLSNFNLVGKDSISDSSEENISVFIYENKGVLPRAFIVRNAEVVEDKKLILEEIKNETFNPREYVLLEENLGVALKNLGEFQEAEITSKTPNEIKVRVNLSSPGFLVLSEVWYPSWRAYDNGIETKVYKADYVLRAVYLASGDHTVEFRYDSSYFKVGAFVSLAAILVLSAICFARIKRHSTSRIT
jgi:hypothetical protein